MPLAVSCRSTAAQHAPPALQFLQPGEALWIPPTLLGMSRLIHCQRGHCRAYKQAGLHSMAAQLRE